METRIAPHHSTKTLLSIGHGYSGRAMEAALGPEWTVLGTSRQPGSAAVHWPDGIEAALAKATHLISWVPPAREPDIQADPVLPLLANLPAPRLRWIGYASATSVYGDAGGAWTDDTAPDAPTTSRGHARLQAETEWRAFAATYKVNFCTLRIAGIYGPGRSVLEALRAGRAKRIQKPGQVFNRIHVFDLARIAAACAQHEITGPIIASDDLPAPLADVTAYGATLLGLPCPPLVAFDDADLSPIARSFYAENKRLRARRIKEDLKLELRYPTYREGLKGLLTHSRP